MGIFDRGQGRERREQQQQQTELDKANLPDGKREDVRRPKPMDMRKGSEVLHDPNFGKRPNDHGRDAPLDPMRQAKPEMMAVVSVMIPELANSRSPQAAGLMKEFENPAVVRAYLINPQKTAEYLGQKFPEMRAALHKNAPFEQDGAHLRANQSSGLYDRIQQEVAQGIKPSQSFVRNHMDKLLSSAIPASLGGSAGLETKAYELLRNRAENPSFNQEGARIEHTIAKLMKSPQAREDLKEVAGIAAERTAVPTKAQHQSQNQPQQAKGAPPTTAVPTTTGQQVQGPLKQVSAPAPGPVEQPQISAPPPPSALPKMVPATEPILAGANKSGGGIVIPEIKPAGVPTTNGTTITGPLQPVNPSTPSAPRPPLMSAINPTTEVKPAVVPVIGGGVVQGELKMVPPSAPVPTVAPTTEPKPASTPELKPTAPLPDQLLKAQNQQMEATIAKLEDTLKKATDTTEAMMKKLQESEARNADLMKRLEESERRAQRMELKSDVNDILRDQNQRTANGKEIDAAITAATKADQKDLPTAEQVVTKITELREQVKQKEIQAQKELEKKITDSFATLPPQANVAQTREWTTKNMDLHNSLDDKGKKAFINYIKNNYKFQQDQETFDPMSFFNRKIADAAALEISNATRARQVYIPTGSSIPNAMPQSPTTFYEPDPIRIAEVLRSVSDLKDVLPYVAASRELKEARDKLPREGFIFKEDGIHQKAIDARLAGNKIEAEALYLRSLIDNGDMRDDGLRRKVIREALGGDKQQSDLIRAHYKTTFGTDLRDDLRKANSRQIAEQQELSAEVQKDEEALRKQQEELQQKRERAKAAAAKVDDLLE